MVDNYRIQYAYSVNKADPEYKGGWNEIHNTARVYTPEDKAIQTPNSDTPYSAVGADLRRAIGAASLLMDNPLQRYPINSPMLPSLVADPDGGYTFTSRTRRRADRIQLAARAEGPIHARAAAVLAEARRTQRRLEVAQSGEDLTPCRVHAYRRQNRVIK